MTEETDDAAPDRAEDAASGATRPVTSSVTPPVTPSVTPSVADPFALSPRVHPEGKLLPAMITHAQNFEDVILRRVLQDVEQGFYVDIGAWHPERDSVTRHFYYSGWRGVNVEPEPEAFAALAAARPRDINIQCLAGGEERTELFVCRPNTGVSSIAKAAPGAAGAGVSGGSRILPTPVISLDRLLALREGVEIDFLKIDVEGMEAELLAAAAFEAHRPRVVVVEATLPNLQVPNHEAWEPGLVEKGYEFVYFDGLNRMYLRAEDAWRKPRFACPPCCFDNFMEETIHYRLATASPQP